MTTTSPVATPGVVVEKRRKNGSGSRALGVVSQALVVLGFLVVWGLFAQTPTADRADMPGPLAAFAELFERAATAEYWEAVVSTIGSWSMALLIALVVGVPLGLIIGRSRMAFDSSKWTIDFLRTIPSVAFVPLALLMLGRSQLMVIIVAAIPAVWPLIIQSIYAGQQADPILHRVARTYHLTWRDRVLYVLAPDALAFIWPGVRLATTAALLVTIFAELLGGTVGIGSAIMEAQIYNRPAALYAWVLTACFLGLILNGLLALVQKKLLAWHPSMRGKDS